MSTFHTCKRFTCQRFTCHPYIYKHFTCQLRFTLHLYTCKRFTCQRFTCQSYTGKHFMWQRFTRHSPAMSTVGGPIFIQTTPPHVTSRADSWYFDGVTAKGLPASPPYNVTSQNSTRPKAPPPKLPIIWFFFSDADALKRTCLFSYPELLSVNW